VRGITLLKIPGLKEICQSNHSIYFISLCPVGLRYQLPGLFPLSRASSAAGVKIFDVLNELITGKSLVADGVHRPRAAAAEPGAERMVYETSERGERGQIPCLSSGWNPILQFR
jgi:hypothetical protein